MDLPGLLRNKRFAFYMLAIIVTLAVWVLQRYMRAAAPSESGIVSSTSLNQPNSSDAQSSVSPANSSDPQGKAIDIYMIAASLLTTLATALLGALGYLLMNERQAKAPLQHRVPATALLSATLAVVSIYFGYRCDSNALWYASQGAFTPDAPPLVWPKIAQFVSLLLAVFFFTDFIFNELGTEPLHGEHEKS
jgi:hypothetical protein